MNPIIESFVAEVKKHQTAYISCAVYSSKNIEQVRVITCWLRVGSFLVILDFGPCKKPVRAPGSQRLEQQVSTR